jgi:23S rRNA pseudouridine1911/1915/1917 synthase
VTRPTAAEELQFQTTSALQGERIDRAIALVLGLSRALAARLVAGGMVRVGGAVVRAGSRKLRMGEVVKVDAPAGEGRDTGDGKGLAGDHQLGAGETDGLLEPKVVFADAHLMVVDKPAGLVVHPGAGNRTGTLVQKLVALFPDIEGTGPDADRPGVVHRLDKGTSGLLVVARTEEARAGLVKQLAARAVLRRYLAVVYGEIPDEEGIIEAPLGRSPSQRLRVGVVQSGRPARTRYRVLGLATRGLPATLVSCRLETGRTHQVRAHFAAIGHPVLGDERYAGAGRVALSRRAVPGLSRPWLHATELGFVHPVSGKAMNFESVPPPELAEALRALGLEGGPGG